MKRIENVIMKCGSGKKNEYGLWVGVIVIVMRLESDGMDLIVILDDHTQD